MRERLPRLLRPYVRPGRLGPLRPPRPVSERWGYDRGTPIDRYYIERFLDAHRPDIHGRLLEVKDGSYAYRFGTDLTAVDIVDVDPANATATIVGDLASPATLPRAVFDCAILTQTLQYVVDVDAAVVNTHAALTPGGVLLAAVPAISRMTTEMPGLVDFRHFTRAGCESLLGAVFGDAVEVEAYGNVAAACAFLLGLAAEELTARELEHLDERYPVVLSLRAVKH